jgi:hypothetical protein
MLVTVGTLVAGFAVVAVACEAHLAAFIAGGLAYWLLTNYRQFLVTAWPVRRRRLWADGRSAWR